YSSLRSRILPSLEYIARSENPWYLRLQAVQYLKIRLSQDPEIKQLLRRLKEEEKHPILRATYQKLL
ncbi:MAG: hypothetical protein RMJ66_05890, partial [Bacteroidia bacterium]|nr:hypothetical protein [Bacteroidia bacterium]MDW8134581.1 hypothetical protein [Bacteroidia bacterium]